MRFIFSIAVLFLSISFSFGQIYVTPNGTGDGSSWAQATNIENAIASAPIGTELRLRGGTYDITTTLSVTRRLTINGGYTGVGTDRNIVANPSTLDGGGSTKIMIIRGGGTAIDGLTFLAGFAATGAHVNDGSGGGAMYVQAGDVTITNCIFRDNISAHRIGSGALYLFVADNIRIEDCLFENNRVEENISTNGNIGGGAIHVRFGNDTRILNTVFRNNYSRYAGGAVQDWGDNTLFEDCVFEDNESRGQGGALYVPYDYTRIDNSTFEGNKGTNGGGIASGSGRIEISASRFEHNQAEESGGAIYNHRFADPSIIVHVQFVENTAAQGGAIYNYSEEGLQIVSSLFTDNQATDKGGAIFNNRFIEITNTTFVRNSNTAVIIPSNTQTGSNNYNTNIYNSIFHLNTAKTGGYRADIHSADLDRDLSTKDIRQNITQEYAEAGNQVGANPLFVNNTDNFRLQTSSPAINTGNNALFNGISPTAAGASNDLASEPRLFGATIDLGAYELQEEPVITVPDCAVITAPANNATGVSLTPTITWNTAANATGYYLSIGTDPDTFDIVNNQDLGLATSYTLPIALDPNTIYYISVIAYNALESASDCSQVRFTTLAGPDAPTAEPQSFCGVATVQDLVAIGTDLRWYSQASGGTPLSNTVSLQTGDYYVSQTVDGLESPRTQVAVTVNITPTPVIPDQPFPAGATFSDLDITGQNIRWYAVPDGGDEIAPGTTIEEGTFYVTQTINGCESNRLSIHIKLTYIEYNIVFDSETFTYNGLEQSIYVSGELPPDAEVTYANNNRRDVGSQIVQATISAPNFQTVTLEAQLIITPARLTIQARDTTKNFDNTPFYGGNEVLFMGFLSDDSEQDMEGELTYGGTSQGAIHAGTYSIEISGLSHRNYEIQYLPGTLSIVVDELVFPNVITPGAADGLNDTFAFRHIYNIARASLIVFNTDGLEVYSSHDYQDDFTGHGLNKGTYFYLVRYTDPNNADRLQEKRGFLTIL